jgi:hypothetical protein
MLRGTNVEKKTKYTCYQNTHTIVKTPAHYKTHTYAHPNIAKQVKTTTVQDTHKWKSHNTVKYPQYKVTLMYVVFCPQELHRNYT